MPWHVEEREGEFCVIKDSDGSSAGCHSSREKANSQLRALYANEPSMSAALELDTTALMEEFFPDPEPLAQRLQIEVGSPNDKMLYGLVSSLSAMSERLVQTEQRQSEIIQALVDLSEQMKQDREALTAAVTSMAEPVVNVTVPEPVVNVTVPEPVIHVNVPDVQVTVPEPIVHVHVPQPKEKQVTIKRDPITNLIASVDFVSEN